MIKTIFITTFIFTLLVSFSWTYALSETQKGKILNDFKQKQYDLIFESNLWNITSEFWDIFDVANKVNLYENIWNETQKKREEVQLKNEEVIKKITSLEEALKQLDDDINIATIKVKKINDNIIIVKDEIEVNTNTVELLKKKISENMELLLEYMIYIYKKWNTVYEDNELDNLKSILLNEENIWDVINDLYYNWIVQVTGKNLIDKHKKYVSELYLDKLDLEKRQKSLVQLRKMWVIEKKALDDKKDFKERILAVSKWQQSVYEKYVSDKLKIEKSIQLKTFQEKLKFNSIKNNILKKHNCDYVDISKNSAESRVLSWKCLDINKMIYSESQLSISDKQETYNLFDWPVEPNKWISTFFHDSGYLKDFWSEHDAIDIAEDQWTPIKAPADWYVIYVQKPVNNDYAYVVLKHYDWYITVYWHVSDVFVEEYDYIKKWQVFAQTGWEFGTFWAWYLTTWPHLHFEVFKDKEYVDPFSVLDLSYIKFTQLPDKYKYKFYNDFKLSKWYEYKDKSKNSRLFVLVWDTEMERQKYLISKYAIWAFNNWQIWIDESLDWNIDPSFVMCVWLAETWLWRNMKTPYNVWNVWNTDSGATKTYPNARSWIYSMVRTFNNKYLWQYSELNKLSRYGNKDLSKPIYASSEDNWHNNIITCLSHLKWSFVPDNYNYRLINY